MAPRKACGGGGGAHHLRAAVQDAERRLLLEQDVARAVERGEVGRREWARDAHDAAVVLGSWGGPVDWKVGEKVGGKGERERER